MGEEIVEILCGKPGIEGRYLHKVYDPGSDTYFIPILHPYLKDLKEKLEKDRKTTAKAAIIDTGVMFDHPWIKNSLEDSINFSDDKVDYDLNGHGTLVALLFLALASHSKILNVKVMNKMGRGEELNVIKGINWAVKHGANLINISVGIDRKRYGLFSCKGDCKLCNEIKATADAGVFVFAASGNEPNKTYCPARVAFLEDYPRVFAVGAYDFEKSGKGTLSMPGNVFLVPVNKE